MAALLPAPPAAARLVAALGQGAEPTTRVGTQRAGWASDSFDGICTGWRADGVQAGGHLHQAKCHSTSCKPSARTSYGACSDTY